jgi:hypothetical protein
MLSALLILVGTIIVFFLLLYNHSKHQSARVDWLNALNDIRNSVGQTIIWDTPVLYSSSKYFKLFWKSIPFDGRGLLCELEDKLIFIGYYHERQLVNKISVLTQQYVYNIQEIRYDFDLENIQLMWVGRFWVNGSVSWFALSSKEETHYFTSDRGKYLTFGSEFSTKRIYHKLGELIMKN